ncbi:hypothetical protein H4R21_003391, partial [Coemansia helicoidea]
MANRPKGADVASLTAAAAAPAAGQGGASAICGRLSELRRKLPRGEETETAALQELIGELEELAMQAAGSARDPDHEVRVHHQTLRLAHAATAGDKTSVGDAERAALAGFYGMLIAGVQAGELDEKLCPVAGDVSRHLRLLAARSTALAPDAAGGATYAEIAGTVDRVLGASGPPAVRMPKLASMSLAPD